MSDEGGGTEDGASVVVVSGDDYSSSVQMQTMESHDLPTELTSADLESLANNPSLWLGLDGSLVGNSELSTLQATEIASVDIDGLSHAPATISLDNICETEMSYVGVESLEEEIIQSQEIEESMEIVPANEEPYVEDIECSMEVEVGAHEECEVQAPQIVLKPPAPVQRSFIAQPKRAAGPTTQYILNQSTGQTILFTSKPSTSTPTSITLPVTAGGTQSFRLISPAKTLTLAQAQQMGLISPKKGQTLIVNKLALPSVTKPAAQTGLKPTSMAIVKTGPAKIAPAPPTALTTAVTLVGGMQQPILLTASPASGSQLIMKSSSAPIRMVTAISPNKIVAKSQPAATFGTVRSAGATPVRPNTPTTHYIRIPASQALAAGLVPAGPQLQLASGGGKIQLVRLVGSAGMSPNKGPRAVLQGTQMRHIAPLPGTQTIVRMATPHQVGNASKTVTVVSKGTTVSAASRLLLSTASFGGSNNSNVVMLPASVLSSSFVTQVSAASGIMTTAASRVATATTTSSATQIKPKEPASAKMTASSQSQPPHQQAGAGGAVGQSSAPQIRAIVESNGLRPRKPCNCTKSQCLKLYCDCFANGEFCYQCNCVNCFNNLSHEEERQKSIKQCLDRNPNAFRPKIGKSSGDSRRHNKGCHCKRSGCLKNYCECYEAKICCTDACRCIGCKNVDEYVDRKPLKEALDAEPRLPTPAGRVKMPASSGDAASPHDFFPGSISNTVGSSSSTRGGASGITTIAGTNAGPRPAFSFVTQEVVEATCQCLLARAEEAQEAGKNVADTQLLVLEEFGRCLLQIIDYANKAKGSPS